MLNAYIYLKQNREQAAKDIMWPSKPYRDSRMTERNDARSIRILFEFDYYDIILASYKFGFTIFYISLKKIS